MSRAATPRSSSVPVPGNHALRVTVGLPRQLKELRGEAGRAFHTLLPQQKFQLWHQGKTLLKEPQQMSWIKDGDLVVVKPEEEVPTTTGQTSHQAEFVAHPLPQKYVRRKDQPLPGAKFEGITENAAAYVNHPRENIMPVRPKSCEWKPHQGGFQGVSTYKLHYPGHAVPLETRKLQDAWKPNSAPFDGTTSYTHDYVKHPTEYNRAKRQPQRHWVDAPFQGESTYAQAFRPHAGARPATPMNPGNKILENVPFQGTSEYANIYQKHPLNSLVCHLEPALDVGSKPARPGSAPPQRGVRRAVPPGQRAGKLDGQAMVE